MAWGLRQGHPVPCNMLTEVCTQTRIISTSMRGLHLKKEVHTRCRTSRSDVKMASRAGGRSSSSSSKSESRSLSSDILSIPEVGKDLERSPTRASLGRRRLSPQAARGSLTLLRTGHAASFLVLGAPSSEKSDIRVAERMPDTFRGGSSCWLGASVWM